jgi:hypothetical protein
MAPIGYLPASEIKRCRRTPVTRGRFCAAQWAPALVYREARIFPPVTCAECGAETDERARGWRAMLGEEWETDGSLYVVT